MKRRDLVKLLEKHGWRLTRTKGDHDIYTNPGARRPIPIGRHREIKDKFADAILKEAGIPDR
jgi:predicted RNA binding protein YcfA (HicA-like mRNA interferase family)